MSEQLDKNKQIKIVSYLDLVLKNKENLSKIIFKWNKTMYQDWINSLNTSDGDKLQSILWQTWQNIPHNQPEIDKGKGYTMLKQLVEENNS